MFSSTHSTSCCCPCQISREEFATPVAFYTPLIHEYWPIINSLGCCYDPLGDHDPAKSHLIAISVMSSITSLPCIDAIQYRWPKGTFQAAADLTKTKSSLTSKYRLSFIRQANCVSDHLGHWSRVFSVFWDSIAVPLCFRWSHWLLQHAWLWFRRHQPSSLLIMSSVINLCHPGFRNSCRPILGSCCCWLLWPFWAYRS